MMERVFAEYFNDWLTVHKDGSFLYLKATYYSPYDVKKRGSVALASTALIMVFFAFWHSERTGMTISQNLNIHGVAYGIIAVVILAIAYPFVSKNLITTLNMEFLGDKIIWSRKHSLKSLNIPITRTGKHVLPVGDALEIRAAPSRGAAQEARHLARTTSPQRQPSEGARVIGNSFEVIAHVGPYGAKWVMLAQITGDEHGESCGMLAAAIKTCNDYASIRTGAGSRPQGRPAMKDSLNG